MEMIRCLCRSTLLSNSVIKCKDPKCNAWQHIPCVLNLGRPVEGVLTNPPDTFYCETCRLSRADPFWKTISHPLYPVKLNITNISRFSASQVQSIVKTFYLTREDMDLLLDQEYDLQAWSMLLNDDVMFRMQWPQFVVLQVNGAPVHVSRTGGQLLGPNDRDDGISITPFIRDGINTIMFGGYDARIFCVGVRLVKRQTLRQVLNTIPNESEGEHFEDSLARVRRCVGGGAAQENAESDTDVEVIAALVSINLRCTVNGSRIKVAGRFKHCAHMGCFDLEAFVEMNQQSKKWQCPICMKNYSLDDIVIDPYFNRITSLMQNCEEDVTNIEVKPDGSWRAKAEGNYNLGDLGLWHLPDGSICSSRAAEPKQKTELKPIRPEVGPDSHSNLRLRLKKNKNGCWEFCNPREGTSHSNRIGEGTSRSNRIDKNSENEENIVPTDAPTQDADVIVIDDREEEMESVPSSGGILDASNEIPGSKHEDVALDGSSYLDFYNATNDDLEIWSLLYGSQGAPNVSDLFEKNRSGHA
ncbi:hypothetical protein CDL12_26761 [Handroanthus impetiginosus]|uniref:SP-RING-type domain-containing protein n=1 Tax=Handroanthus impetiginosus TaxID=429701 RepID=A0A2G9G600_9LAMI|nr:hypothetical protein CDL12_26761 [Handroanthus impetiginosus]